MDNNNKNILCVYGPLVQIDFIKANLLNDLDALTNDISQEKILHQHISITTLPTPYKTELCESKQIICDMKETINATDNIDDVVHLQYHLDNFQQNIRLNLEIAYHKTATMLTQIRTMATLNDLKGRLKNDIAQRVKNAISKPVTDNSQNIQSHQTVNASVAMKNRISEILQKKNEKLKKNIEEDLLYCTNTLLKGEWKKLQDHFYFTQHPEYLREYKQTADHLDEKNVRLFLVLQAKKIVTQNPTSSELEIYDKFISFFGKLMNYDQYKQTMAHGVENLKHYVNNLKAIKKEKDILKNNDLSDDKKNVYMNLKKYLTKHPENVY
jgi:hypothetical protein